MKKFSKALLLFAFFVSMPLVAKSKSSKSSSGTSHKSKSNNDAFGAAHKANRNAHKDGNAAKQCDANYASCMKMASNPQMQTMCTQMKQQCGGQGK